MKTIKFDVFGRDVLIVGSDSGWKAFYPGSEGKRRPARDIVIPPGVKESKLAEYLDDLCHEWANDRNSSVNRVD
jgi:hypothetical protein